MVGLFRRLRSPSASDRAACSYGRGYRL